MIQPWSNCCKTSAVVNKCRGIVTQRIKRPGLAPSGGGACPPEDCGGPPGFKEFKLALADPTHPEHEDLKNWYGGEFDADAFSVEATSALVRQVATGELPDDWG